MVRVEEDVVVEEKIAIAELCVDIACFCVEFLEDSAREILWRWLVINGMDPINEEKRGENI
jgi:hypothetical protein